MEGSLTNAKQVPSSATPTLWPALNANWGSMLKYLAMGTVIAGSTYFIFRQIQHQQARRGKIKKIKVVKLKQDLPPPVVGGPKPAGNLPTNNEESRSTTATVSQLVIYPIKSCRGIYVESFVCGEMGPEIFTDNGTVIRDRTWMVTTSNYVFITQRKKPKMSLIVPSIHGSQLEINAPGMSALRVPLCPDVKDYKKVLSEVWGDKIATIDLGDEAGAWFAEYLELAGARFIYHPPGFDGRDLSAHNGDVKLWEKGDSCAFADGAPFLLLSEETVEDLNTRLDPPITWNHFRPNILVHGCTAYNEDKWEKFSIESAEFRNTKLCTRCTMTTVDPQLGTLSRKDVLSTLKSYRVNQSPEWETTYETSPLIAINLGLDKSGTISVGDLIIHK